MATNFSITLERNGILAIGLQLTNRSGSRSGFFGFGRTCEVFNEVGKTPVAIDCLTILLMEGNNKFMLPLTICVGIGSRAQVLFENDVITSLIFLFDGGMNSESSKLMFLFFML